MERYGLIIERTLVDSKNAMIYSRIYNPREENVKIYRHTHITLFTPNDNVWQVFELRTSKSNKEQIEVNESLITDIPEHLRCSQRDTNTLIKRKQRHSKNSILVSKISLAKPGEVGRTNLGYHEIKLHDEKLIREPPRRVSIHKRSLKRGR